MSGEAPDLTEGLAFAVADVDSPEVVGVVVEQVFLYPGIGQTAVAAGLQSDVPLLLGIVVISAVFVFVGNLIADILYYFVDPRIKENEI